MSDDVWTALDDGRLANLDVIVSLRESVMSGGPAHGTRAIDVQVWGGVDLRILPDRGFDLGQAWFDGIPLAWVSAVGEAGPLSDPQGMAWLDAFGGGLLTTCELRHVGAPEEGHGLHGTYSHLRASGVDVRRSPATGWQALLRKRPSMISTRSAIGPTTEPRDANPCWSPERCARPGL